MICSGCGNQEAYQWRMNKYGESCNKCANFIVNTFDVFFKEPSFEEHLADLKHPQGQWVTSKSHKARLMKEQGVREAGDRTHGSRF